MHRHDGLYFRPARHLIPVEIVSIGVYIGKSHFQPAIAHRQSAGHKGIGRHHHFIPGFQPAKLHICADNQPQCVEPVGHSNNMVHSERRRQTGFKSSHFRSAYIAAGGYNTTHGTLSSPFHMAH